MSDDPRADVILTRFRTVLGKVYGDRHERVVRITTLLTGCPLRMGRRTWRANPHR
jgi:hypothetical protein